MQIYAKKLNYIIVHKSNKRLDGNMEMVIKHKVPIVITSLGLDKAVIKQAYRKLSFSLHPDRVEGDDEEKEAAAERFGRVKLAYDTLSSGVRQDGVSWYESLGGRARTGFTGPVSLLPLVSAQEQMTRRNAEAAMIGLNPDIIQTFVARNLRSS